MAWPRKYAATGWRRLWCPALGGCCRGSDGPRPAVTGYLLERTNEALLAIKGGGEAGVRVLEV